MIATPSLDAIERVLDNMLGNDSAAYHVPGPWIGESGDCQMSSGTAFFLRQIASIRSCTASPVPMPMVYNVLVRHVTSYDHGIHATKAGWRSTGTFLKLLALLPYLHGLGTTHILLLPFAQRGKAGKKGTLGSPYAVRNPFVIDDDLAEPLLDLPIEMQAKAFVEACHSMGIQVLAEVVLRTASVDSTLIEHHPEWFYWINDQDNATTFSAPEFDEQTLTVIQSHITRGSRYQLPEPSSTYRDRFASVPSHIYSDERGWQGRCVDGSSVRIPGAFADWPPDDPQPAWSDVTYFKLHNHPDLNYMAYNTLRMFDERLESEQYQQHGLWNEISQFIPHLQLMLGVDGCMIDMGHALPHALRSQIMHHAKRQHPNFTIWEECFDLHTELAEQGVDAVTGYLPLSALNTDELKEFTKRCASTTMPIRYFGAVESHNTPRAHARVSTKAAFATWLYLSLLPQAYPFVLSGFELGETVPVNTGLGFTKEELAYYRDHPLPLFDDVQLPWRDRTQIVSGLQHRAASIRNIGVYKLLTDIDSVILLDGLEEALGYVRIPPGQRRGILVLLNTGNEDVNITLLRSEFVDVAVHQGIRRHSDGIEIHVISETCVILPVLLNLSGQIYQERRADGALASVK